ncbi:MAG: nuclear transport factor 2 family protein [Gaiellaceae bacterium]
MRFTRVLVLLAALVLALAPGLSAATGRPAPTFADPNVAGSRLVDDFFTLLVHKDAAGLQRFLSPAFQVQRADGSAAGKSVYLAALPTVTAFTITNLAATQTGGVIVVRYLATATGLVNGKPYTPGPAPRLSVFTWTGAQWQLAAHANFNPLNG